MIFIIICANIKYQGKHKRVILDRVPLELVDAETIRELKKRAELVYQDWCGENDRIFPNTWHYLRGEF